MLLPKVPSLRSGRRPRHVCPTLSLKKTKKPYLLIQMKKNLLTKQNHGENHLPLFNYKGLFALSVIQVKSPAHRCLKMSFTLSLEVSIEL